MWAINSGKQISPLLLVSAARNIRSIASWPPAGVILQCVYAESCGQFHAPYGHGHQAKRKADMWIEQSDRKSSNAWASMAYAP